MANEGERKEAIKQTRPSESGGYGRNPDDLPPGDFAGWGAQAAGSAGNESPDKSPGDVIQESLPQSDSDSWALRKATTIYSNYTTYMEANVTRQWERNIAHFRGEHAPGSNYRKKDWRRSRTFRPKTRSNVKAQEASAAAAIFSTIDIVDVQPVDKTNERMVISAQIRKKVIEHRLSGMPWFLTVIGAYQDTKVYGLCISAQYWEYKYLEEDELETDDQGTALADTDPATGEIKPRMRKKKHIMSDRPMVDLIEPENFGFDPMADWRDPVNTSPYLIWLRPMYAGDVLDMMDEGKPNPWRKYNLAQVLSVRKYHLDNERTKQAREGNQRTDPVDQQRGSDEHTTVWAHLNVSREGGIDYGWWTLGTQFVLTDPVPLHEMPEFQHLRRGERPFAVGYSTIEAHRNHPAGDVEQSAPLQTEINEVANLRYDNIKLALNKRWMIRRGSQIDLEALVRNVPGGGIMVNDPDKDVKEITTNDVTGSSYQEQDRLATDFDELVGGFSQTGQMSSKARGAETAKGLQQVAGSAGAVQDYGVKIFFVTWLDKVLNQVDRLITYYENDETILALAAKNSDLWIRYGSDQVTDDLMEQDLLVRVNVAIGNTDPMRRVERLVFAIANTSSLPDMGPRLKSINVANEIFGALGFEDSTRFFMTDEELAADQEKKGPPPPPPDVQVKMLELEIRKQDNEMRDKREQAKLELQREIEYAKIALQEQLSMEELYTRLGIEQAKLRTARDTTALKEANRMSEMNIKLSQPPKPPAQPNQKPGQASKSKQSSTK